MPTLSVNGFIGKAPLAGERTSATNFIRSATGRIQSLLGYKSRTLIIGALEENEKNLFQRAYNQFYGNISSLGSPMAEKLSDEYKQDGVPVDAIMDYEGEISVTISKNPVQKSADINDTRIRQPMTLQIELGVSNDVISDVVGQAKRIIAGVASLAGYDLYDRRLLTFNKFKQLLFEGKPFKIITPHGEYENMLLTRIRPHTTEETQGLFYGTLYFQQIITFDEIQGNLTQPQARTPSELRAMSLGAGVDGEWVNNMDKMVSNII